MTGLYKGTVGSMLCSLGLFSETFTGSRRHSQDVFPLGVSPWEWNKALHLSATQPCGAERGRGISSCRVNHVYNSDANDLWLVTWLGDFQEISQQNVHANVNAVPPFTTKVFSLLSCLQT